MKPTIRSVANQANVSVATVSRVLNGLGGYSKETEDKVLDAIKNLGYEVNAIARGLATKSSRTIGVLLPNTPTDVFTDVLNGIEEIAHVNNYSVIICFTGSNGKKTIQYLKTLAANQVAGIIYTSSQLFEYCYSLIKDMKIPCVLALTASYQYQLPYVKVDDTQASYTATRHLIENGHKKIAIIAACKDDPIVGKTRIAGYREALSDFGLEFNEKLLVEGDFSFESGEKGMNQLLDSKEKFTAVFATCDDMAVGALNAAHKRGIEVPNDISLIGYDNTKVSRISYPNLTTISQPLYEIGKKSAEKLIYMIEKHAEVDSTILNHELIKRDTVRNLNK